MNKKFMVVALMATLSTVGYAAKFELTHESVGFGTGAQGSNYIKVDKNFQDVENRVNEIEGSLDRIYDDVGVHEQRFNGIEGSLDKIYDDVGRDHAKLEENITKVENMGAELANKADKNYVDGKVTELGDHVREEMDTVRGEVGNLKADVFENKENIDFVKGEVERVEGNVTVLQSKFEEHKVQQAATDKAQDEKIEANKTAIAETNKQVAENTSAIKNHGDRLGALESNYAQYDGRLSGLEKKVDHLDDKMNKGLSLMAAMNAVDFQNVQTGEMALGAGIGHYGNAQSVALGVAYAPVEDLTVNAKYSITAGDVDSFALGAGATYKFKVGR